MKGYVQDNESIATGKNDFRSVLETARNSQLVVMTLKPQEDTFDHTLVRTLLGKA